MKTLVMGLAGLAILAAPLAASAEPYGHWRGGGGWNHEYRGGYGRGYDRDDNAGAAIVAGVAGLALGAALADRGDYGYAPDYGYGYAPAYYGYAPRCAWRYQPYRTYYGGVAYRQVEICR